MSFQFTCILLVMLLCGDAITTAAAQAASALPTDADAVATTASPQKASSRGSSEFLTSLPPRLAPADISSPPPAGATAQTTVAPVNKEGEEGEEYFAWYGILVIRRISLDAEGVEVITKEKTCTSFYPELTDMAQNETTASFYPVLDVLEWVPCASPPPLEELGGHLLLLDGSMDDTSNCSLLEAATLVQEVHGAKGSVFVRDKRPPSQNASDTSLWITFISNQTYSSIVSSPSDQVELAVYSPRPKFSLNYSLFVIWVLAVVTVTVGAYWSGIVRHKLYQENLQLAQEEERGTNNTPVPEAEGGGEAGGEYDEGEQRLEGDGVSGRRGSKIPVYPKEETSLDISPRVALFFVLLMCIMLVSLYFLYQYLVYMIIALFCLASVAAVYNCLEPLVLRMPCATCRTPYFNLLVLRGQLEVRHVLLLLFSLGLTITWLVLRNEPYAWVLQDILGVAFCINMLRMVRLPNLKICTVLLSCLFFYDIFFVFITPLFTANGTSIMVEVAQGSGAAGGEQLPMVFKVPHFTYTEVVDVCHLPGNYNLLGFGDVLVPGLLLAYVFSFDLKIRGPKCPIYFIVNVIAYGLGLCVTFVGLYLMRGAQPALLYLVPFTLLPTVVIAAIRGDLADMWRGDTRQTNDSAAATAAKGVSEEDVSVVVTEQPPTT